MRGGKMHGVKFTEKSFRFIQRHRLLPIDFQWFCVGVSIIYFPMRRRLDVCLKPIK